MARPFDMMMSGWPVPWWMWPIAFACSAIFCGRLCWRYRRLPKVSILMIFTMILTAISIGLTAAHWTVTIPGAAP